jgi:alpha-D-xyloside xylohydrolase
MLRHSRSVAALALISASIPAAFDLAACGGDETHHGKGGGGAGGAACTLHPAKEEPLAAPKLHTPRWAFEPWISKDISDTADTYDFVGGFEQRNIPVGAVVLDSPWETNYNSLVPNPNRYNDFDKLVSDMHAKNVHVVLWLTAFVNSGSFDLEPGGDSYAGGSPEHDEALACGYFVDGGQEYGWWKGLGASVDFLNPDAASWWHGRQDPLFASGIDGFKLDFGDSYVTSDPVLTKAGPVPHQTYSEAYYHDFYAYGRKQRGDEFVTMVRAWDESYGLAGRFFAKKEDAPIAWMGDNRRDYVGLADALDEMFRSANAGYAVLGSDIGGYLDRDDLDLTKKIPLDPVVFARWTAIGALSPFMQLHGRANLTPWTVPQTNDEITNLYRYWATLHHELVPFFYSLTEATYAGGPTPMVPVGDEATWKGDYRYMLGTALLVAPILDGTGKRDVALPPGTWYDWFDPAGDAIAGGTTLASYDTKGIDRVPLFVKAGAIVPLVVGEDVTGLGDASSAGSLTVLAYPDTQASSFALRDTDEQTTTLSTQGTTTSFSFDASRALTPLLVRVRTSVTPTTVTAGGASLSAVASRAALSAASSGYFVDATTRSVWVKLPASAQPVHVAGS